MVHRLASRFLTKRVLNVDAVAQTIKPLWNLVGELKIRDIWEHIILFEFEDSLNLERVFEFEPWSYDKHLVAFQRVYDVELAPYLEFSRATFWIQFHNIPELSLKHKTGELIGKSMSEVLQVSNPEDDGSRGEFFRVQINLNISKSLPCCSKLQSKRK